MTRIKTVRERTSVPSQLAGIVAVVVPPLGLVAAVWLLWNRGVRPVDLVLLAGFYVACGLGITVGFHRLFTHKSFETSAPLRALVGDPREMAMQGPLTQWVTDHRKHHALSDRPGDPHSPHAGPRRLARRARPRALALAHRLALLDQGPRARSRVRARPVRGPARAGDRPSLPALGRAHARAPVPRRLPRRRKLAAGPRGDDLGRPRPDLPLPARDLLDQLDLPLLRRAAVPHPRREPQRLAARDPVVRRVVAQRPPRLPGLGSPRPRARPARHLRARDPGMEKLRLATEVKRPDSQQIERRRVAAAQGHSDTLERATPLARSRRADARRGDDHRRRDDRQRRDSVDHPRPPHRDHPGGVGELDLLAGLRGAPDQRRPHRRRHRPPSRVHLGPPGLPRREPDHRARALGNRPPRRPLPPGGWRSADPPLDALDRERDLPRARAGDRLRDLGLGDRRDGGARPARRRLVRHQPELALGLLRQSPDRSARARRHPALRRREPRSRRTAGIRPTRRRAVDPRLPRRRLRADRGTDLRLVDRPAGLPRPLTRRAVRDPVRLRARRALPRSVRPRRAAPRARRDGRCSSTSRSSGSRPSATATSQS